MSLKKGNVTVNVVKKAGNCIYRMLLSTVSYIIGNTNTFTTLPTITNLTNQNGSLVAQIGTTLGYTPGELNNVPVTGETVSWKANGTQISTASTLNVPSSSNTNNLLIEVTKNAITGSSISYPIKYAIPTSNGTHPNTNITKGNGIYSGSLRPYVLVSGDTMLLGSSFTKISGPPQFTVLNNGDWNFENVSDSPVKFRSRTQKEVLQVFKTAWSSIW